jgi:shikimate dehydrogenase
MSVWPVGTTKLAAVVGHPIRHSLSPVLHNAAFAATKTDWVFLALDVDHAHGEAAFAGARALGVEGLSVTMPLKEVAARCVDRLSPTASALNAVNTVVREEGGLVGHNTDGQGFLDNLAAEQGWEAAGRRCVVLGAGGAARAVVLALAGAGAGEVTVVNRTADRAEAAAALAGAVGRVGTADDAAGADLVVNATPVGMTGTDGAAWETVTSRLGGSGQLVVDLVYWPVRTPFLEAAAAQGARTSGGLGMLVHQAARAFTLWTGRPAPLAIMSQAALVALGAPG